MKKLLVWGSTLLGALIASSSANAYVVTTADLAQIDSDITANLAVIIPFTLGIFVAIFGAKLVFRLIRSFVSQSA